MASAIVALICAGAAQLPGQNEAGTPLGLVVETSDDARSAACPASHLLLEAMGARSLAEQKEPLETSVLVVTLRTENGRWMLRLTQPDGQVALVRRFPPKTDCDALVAACSLVVDRFLTALAIVDSMPAPDPLPTPKPQSPRSIDVAGSATRVSETLPESNGSRGRWFVVAGFTTRLGRAAGVGGPRFGIGLATGLGWMLQPYLQVGLVGSLFLPAKTAIRNDNRPAGERTIGFLSVLPAALTTTVGTCWQSAVRFCLDGAAEVSVTRVTPTGQYLFSKRTVVLWRLGLGGGVAVQKGLSRFGLVADIHLRLLGRIPTAQVTVTGLPTAGEVAYRAPDRVWHLGLGLAKNFL